MKSFLGVLLGVSVLANILLAVRLSRAPEKPEPTVAKTAVIEKRTEADATTLRDSLEAERKKVEELKAKVERLETDKKVLAQEAPAPGKGEKLATFKTKLRKLMKLSKDPAAKAGNVDPESMAEATEVVMEFFKIAALRTKDPATYAEYLGAFYEVGLEGEGTALTEAQSASLAKLFETLGQDLAKIPQTPAGDRLVREIETEAATMGRVNTLLSDAQKTALAKDNMGAVLSGNMMSTSYLMKSGAVDQIAQQWTAAYQLDAAQQAQAKVAAKAYVDAMDRSGVKPSFDKQGSAEYYEYRLRSAREQLAALQVLQASMTPAQQEKFRTQTMRELLIMDGAAFGQTEAVTTPAEK
jgi:hypothetical protein